MRNFFGPAALLLCACSGGDDSTIATQPQPTTDAGPADATVSDVAPPEDSAPPPDTFVAPEVGGDDANPTCAGEATRAACEKCCNDMYPAGLKTLTAAELACACVPSICDGDAGVDAGDAGGSELGTNACRATCAADAGIDMRCKKCLGEALGSAKNKGPCFAQVQSACTGDCALFLGCADGCPKK